MEWMVGMPRCLSGMRWFKDESMGSALKRYAKPSRTVPECMVSTFQNIADFSSDLSLIQASGLIADGREAFQRMGEHSR